MKDFFSHILNKPLEPIPKVFRIDSVRKAIALGLVVIILIGVVIILFSLEHTKMLILFLLLLPIILLLLYNFNLRFFFIFLLSYLILSDTIMFYQYHNIETLHIFLLVILLIYAFQNAFQKKRLFIHTEFNPVISLIIIVTIFEIAYSFWNGNYWYNILIESFAYTSGIILFYILININVNYKYINIYLIYIMILTVIISIIGIFEYTTLAPELIRSAIYVSERVKATFGDPNTLAGLFELIIPIIITYGLTEIKIKNRLFFLAMAVVPIMCLIFTYSRAGFFSTLFSILVITMILLRKKSIVIIIILTIIIVLLALTSTIIARQMFIFNFESLLLDESMRGRYIQYIEYIKIIHKYPIIGVGWGVKQIGYSEFQVSKIPIRFIEGLNSMILDQLVKGGIIYLLPFCFLLFLFVRLNIRFLILAKNTKYYRIALGVLGSFLAFIPHQIVDFTIKRGKTNFLFWFLLGLMYVAYQLCKQEAGIETGKNKALKLK